MKRFWLVLLSLGMVVAFSASAMAVDVKFSGEYYAAGLYLDKTKLVKDTGTDGGSTAFFYQRLRVNMDFVVSPGLTLVTRADIMKRAWGAQRSDVPLVTTNDQFSSGTRAENENIAFDLAFVRYISPIGIFQVGYQIDGQYGTMFGDNPNPTPRIAYFLPFKGFTLGLLMGKNAPAISELSKTAILATTATDRDSDFYTAFINYAWKTGSAGFLAKYVRSAQNRAVLGGDNGFLTNQYIATPFVKATLGPVFVQAQLYHIFGQAAKFEGTTAGALADTRINMIYGWVDATVNLGMFYTGGSIAYVSGNDPGSNAVQGAGGGTDWKPCLILFNNDLAYWAGATTGYNGSSTGNQITNAWFGQLRAGVKPIDKLDIGLAIAYASADKKPTSAWLYNDYGYEVDLTATYKITNNLSYMLGAGYLFTGKYYRGVNDLNSINNDYLLINKLTLTF
jgi:hypothetical protein